MAVSAVGGGLGATLATSALGVGSHQVSAAYSGDSNFAPSVSNTVVEVVSAATVTGGSGPMLMMVQRFGFHEMPTRLVLTFDRALDATAAENLSNYRITTMSGGRIKLKSAVYDDRTHTVTLRPVNRMNLHRRYSISIDGSRPTGVRGCGRGVAGRYAIGHDRDRLPRRDCCQGSGHQGQRCSARVKHDFHKSVSAGGRSTRRYDQPISEPEHRQEFRVEGPGLKLPTVDGVDQLQRDASARSKTRKPQQFDVAVAGIGPGRRGQRRALGQVLDHQPHWPSD